MVWNFASLVPVANVGLDFSIDPGAYLITECDVSFIVVGGVVLSWSLR
jgi:hypothetical protein